MILQPKTIEKHVIAVAIGRVDVTRHIHSWNFPEGYAEAAANTLGGPILKCARG